LTFRTICSLFLAGTLLLPAPGWPQQVSGPKSNVVAETPAAGALKVVVLKGEGAINSIKSKTAAAPVVEVRDDQDKPVSGAEVVFQLPAMGPGAVFNGWMRTQTARTDAQGQAAALGMIPNDEPGRFNIKVTATQGKRTGSVVIGQSNAAGAGTARASKKSHTAIWIAVGLAAAGIAGGVAATRGGSSTATSTTPVTITPGTVTIAGPK
jgi:hypothetical protein